MLIRDLVSEDRIYALHENMKRKACENRNTGTILFATSGL